MTAALLGAWAVFLQRTERSKYWTRMWSAYSVMVLAGCLLLCGVLGWELQDGVPVQIGEPVWWEIGAGLLAIAASFLFFRHARRYRKSVVW